MGIKQLLTIFADVNNNNLNQWHTKRKYLLTWTVRCDLR